MIISGSSIILSIAKTFQDVGTFDYILISRSYDQITESQLLIDHDFYTNPISNLLTRYLLKTCHVESKKYSVLDRMNISP